MKPTAQLSAFAIFAITFLIISGAGMPDSSPELRLAETNDNNELIQKEAIVLHTDRDRYIAGEQIWFSIATIGNDNGIISTMSSLVYVELLNPWNMPVIQSRFSLREGWGECCFQLPDTLRSGTYTVRAYTNNMKNLPAETFFMHDVQIYNAFSNLSFLEKNSQPAPDANQSYYERTFELPQTAKLVSDSVFGRRSKVTVRIETGLNEIADLSISATPKGSEENVQVNTNYKIDSVSGPERFNYEKNGHWLTLKVNYRKGSAADSIKYLFRSVQGKVAEFSYAERNSAGSYSFFLPVDDLTRNFIIQPEVARKNISLEIEPSFSWQIPASTCFPAELPDSILGIFSQMSFNYQASRIYKITARRNKPQPVNFQTKKRRFYGIPEMEVILADYISLPTMQEVFFELLPGIILKPLKNGYEIRITNPLTGSFYAEPPLVMIDGIIINDLTVLADLNPERVEKVEVVKTPYLTGDMILHGIVNVITKTGDFSDISMPDYAVMLPYKVVEEVPDFVAPDYSDPKVLIGRTPDLRNTLYWNPHIKTDSSGKADLTFWTSDLPGKYLINVHGVSVSGKRVTIRKSFTVR
jgi:hypothetical protein